MIDLAHEMNMSFLQTLPVNDTIANKSWTDSYPYAAISVYALHPLYLHIPAITDISKFEWYDEYQIDQKNLNDLSVIDFEEVLRAKTKYTQAIYTEKGKTLLSSKELKEFVSQNEWVKSYAVFCHLRDINNTPNFNKWKDYSIFDQSVIDKFWSKGSPQKEVGYYVFLQYYLDKQLREARDYGREKGVVLKGDLPIGIYRYSCDAWINPHLYYMDQQAGAPPDDYAVDGQNWGFPTYNWEEMSKDNFSWWSSRMTQLANYFDALRIDHILGFFRIWSIPMNQSSGTLGLFNPRLPLHNDELRSRGLTGDLLRYTQPYIRNAGLNALFGERAKEVADTLLEEVWPGAYKFKDGLDTQMKFLDALGYDTLSKLSDLKEKILSLYTEVILIEEPNSNFIYFNPRITLHTTRSYQDLDDHNKRVIDHLYNDYFYQRHSEYWKSQALWKLPALLNASNMFICGEDLGMIPSTVPDVMKRLNIVPLEIQRMPKGNDKYGVCKNYDYATVCSPSCHDMSTIRGWWESSYELAKDYYRNYMGRYEDAPQLCSTEIVEYIVQDHLHSPSMLAIFPIQDILGIDYDLRMGNPNAEQINVPANPKHYWRYRLHIDIEELIANKHFCRRVGNLVRGSSRS
jgi:4-alpha-glucanotransferase